MPKLRPKHLSTESANTGDVLTWNGAQWVPAASSGGGGDASGPASAVVDDVAVFASTTGKLLKDSGVKYTDLAKGVASAVADNFAGFNGTGGKQLQDSGFSFASFYPRETAITALTGASNTLALTALAKYLTVSHTVTSTLTVPLNSSVAFPVGCIIPFARIGVGSVLVSPAAGVTVLCMRGSFRVLGEAWLKKVATDTWILGGAKASIDIDVVADFGADPTGTNASDTAFANAITETSSVKGDIVVPRGTYKLTSGAILLANDGIRLMLSRGAVLKKVGTNFNMVKITANYCEVIGGEIDGNSQAQGSGVLINGAHNIINRLYIHHVGDITDTGSYVNGSHGICLDGQASTCSLNRISSVEISTCHDIGISHNTATDSIISDVEVHGNGLEGMTFDNASHKARTSQARLYGNCVNGGAAGISIDGSDLGNLTACYVSGSVSKPGVITNNNLANSNYWNVVGGTYIGNGTYGIQLKNNGGRTGSWWCITGATFRDNTTAPGIFESGSNNNKLTGCGLNGATWTNSGTGNTLTASS